MEASEKLKLLAPDLTRNFPRSPRATLGGYIIAARCLDKCRALLAGTLGEYRAGCPLDEMFLSFVGIPFERFKEQVATGATDEEMAAWIEANAQPRPRIEIIRWNNEWRGKRLCDLPDHMQEYLEDYIPQVIPRNRPIYHFFDVYDIEEERL